MEIAAERRCLCGCGNRLSLKRRHARFYSDACRDRYHNQERRECTVDLRRTVTVAQYAELTGKTERQVRYAIAKGSITPVRVPAKIMIVKPRTQDGGTTRD
ncbi:MAG: hypothetical protein AABN33_18365 [Acidobacteriota bacterium]